MRSHNKNSFIFGEYGNFFPYIRGGGGHVDPVEPDEPVNQTLLTNPPFSMGLVWEYPWNWSVSPFVNLLKISDGWREWPAHESAGRINAAGGVV